MILSKVRTIKTFLYEYESVQDKEDYKASMLLAQFLIEKEELLSIEFSQVIKEIVEDNS